MNPAEKARRKALTQAKQAEGLQEIHQPPIPTDMTWEWRTVPGLEGEPWTILVIHTVIGPQYLFFPEPAKLKLFGDSAISQAEKQEQTPHEVRSKIEVVGG